MPLIDPELGPEPEENRAVTRMVDRDTRIATLALAGVLTLLAAAGGGGRDAASPGQAVSVAQSNVPAAFSRGEPPGLPSHGGTTHAVSGGS
jgi:hypothetical protein